MIAIPSCGLEVLVRLRLSPPSRADIIAAIETKAMKAEDGKEGGVIRDSRWVYQQ